MWDPGLLYTWKFTPIAPSCLGAWGHDDRQIPRVSKNYPKATCEVHSQLSKFKIHESVSKDLQNLLMFHSQSIFFWATARPRCWSFQDLNHSIWGILRYSKYFRSIAQICPVFHDPRSSEIWHVAEVPAHPLRCLDPPPGSVVEVGKCQKGMRCKQPELTDHWSLRCLWDFLVIDHCFVGDIKPLNLEMLKWAKIIDFDPFCLYRIPPANISTFFGARRWKSCRLEPRLRIVGYFQKHKQWQCEELESVGAVRGKSKFQWSTLVFLNFCFWASHGIPRFAQKSNVLCGPQDDWGTNRGGWELRDVDQADLARILN